MNKMNQNRTTNNNNKTPHTELDEWDIYGVRIERISLITQSDETEKKDKTKL